MDDYEERQHPRTLATPNSEHASDPQSGLPSGPSRVAVEFADTTAQLSVQSLNWLRHHAALAMQHARPHSPQPNGIQSHTPAANITGEVRVRIINDAEMSAAHAQYCNDPTTTDVLTFDLRSSAERNHLPSVLDADVLVCRDQAARQAELRGHSVEQELLLYVLHAMLHCVGYNDHADSDFEAMHREEDRVLHAIGVGQTFGTNLSAAASASDPYAPNTLSGLSAGTPATRNQTC